MSDPILLELRERADEIARLKADLARVTGEKDVLSRTYADVLAVAGRALAAEEECARLRGALEDLRRAQDNRLHSVGSSMADEDDDAVREAEAELGAALAHTPAADHGARLAEVVKAAWRFAHPLSHGGEFVPQPMLANALVVAVDALAPDTEGGK